MEDGSLVTTGTIVGMDVGVDFPTAVRGLATGLFFDAISAF